jgi:ureidoacrylate peracid hydrolase
MTDTPSDVAARLVHVDMLTTLERKVDPGHAALIVVDMQNDFCAPGGMMDAEGRDLSAVQEMATRLPALIDAARRAGALVVFVHNVYSSEGNHYLSDVWLEQASRRRGDSYTRRDVCAAGSWEGDFYGEVRPGAGDPVITKHRFGAFYNTELDTVLRAHGIRTVVLSGFATNVCVETTAREAFLRDYYVVFLEDGTATYADDDHAATLRTIDKNFGQVAKIEDVAGLWERARESRSGAVASGALAELR